MKNIKRTLALIITLLMLLGTVPLHAFAEFVPDPEAKDEVEVHVTATDTATGKDVSIADATVNLYVGSEIKAEAKTDSKGIAKIDLSGLTYEEITQASLTAYKKTAEGKAVSGSNRDALFNSFKNAEGDIIRYEYELHSETIDSNGNWTGKLIPGSTNKVDMVFVIDATGSMSDEISNVKKNIEDFSEKLLEKGLNIRFSIVEYRDITCGEKTKIHTYKGSQWYTDLESVTGVLAKIKATGGGDTPETVLDALGKVASEELYWRNDSYHFAFLLTDAGYKNENNYGYKSMSALIKDLVKKEIYTSVITSSDYKSTYKDLYTKTNGIYANIYSKNFNGEMLKLADSVIKTTSRSVTLKLTEPRIKYNLSVCYLANDDYSKSDEYRNGVKNVLSEYAQNIANTSDGHVLINKVVLFSTDDRLNFYSTDNKASMADIQIQTRENEKDGEDRNITIHSNAAVSGFYDDTKLVVNDDTAEVFENLTPEEKNELLGKDRFYRILMSGVEGSDWNNSMIYDYEQYATTLAHESGHYLFNFYDEYGYFGRDTDGNPVFLPWGTDDVARPDGTMYGLMDNQHDDIEMSSTSVEYKDKECLTDKAEGNSTFHYYMYDASCEDVLADMLEKGIPGTISVGDYTAAYTKIAGDTHRTAIYPFAYLTDDDFITTTDTITPEPDAEGVDADFFKDFTETAAVSPEHSFNTAADTVTLTVTPAEGSEYALYTHAVNTAVYTEVASEEVDGKLVYTITADADSITELRLLDKTAGNYNIFYAECTAEAEKGYVYNPVSERITAYFRNETPAQYMLISDPTTVTNGDYVSVNEATIVSTVNEAEMTGGEIYSVASPNAEIDFNTLAWFRFADGEWTMLETDQSYEENLSVGARADMNGCGIYVLMAKRAGATEAEEIKDVTYTTSDTTDGQITIDFSDANENSKFYNVYYSREAFSSTADEGVASRTFNAENGTTVTLNLRDAAAEYHVAVETVLADGSRSPLTTISATTGEADRDADGIPDWYCDMYNLWAAEGEEKDIADSDDDGDGLTNLEEYLGGSDPRNLNDPVKTENIPVESMTISSSAESIKMGESVKLKAAVVPADASDKAIIWSTGNEKVATVKPGTRTCTVKAVGYGSTYIYAVSRDGGYAARCKLTVTEPDGYHEYVQEITKAATCTKPGKAIIGKCKNCGITNYEEIDIPATGHTYKTTTGKAATCTKDGYKDKKVCSKCSYTTGGTVIKALGHNYVEVVTPSTLTANGRINYVCSRCSVKRTTYMVIPQIKTFTLSANYYTYNGKAKTPSVTVKDVEGNKLVAGTDYKVSYSDNVNIGKATVKVTFKGDYKGTKTLHYTIRPGNVTGVKYSSTKSTVKLSWNAVPGALTYRIYKYNATKKTYTQIDSTSYTSHTFKKLTRGTSYTYYIKASKNVNGVTYISSKYTKVKVATKPGAPDAPVLTAGTKKAEARWISCYGASGYVLYMSSSKTGAFSKVADTTKVSYTKTGLTSGKTYYFKLRSYKTVNGVKVWSDYSPVKSVKIK